MGLLIFTARENLPLYLDFPSKKIYKTIMDIFLDTAFIEEIHQASRQGLLDGVTTNPSLVAKTGKKHEELIKEICGLLKDKPVSAEVLSVTEEKMYQEAKKLAKIHPSVVVKIPLISEGLKAVKRLSQEGISTNVTLCFSPNQALMAAKAGATFVSVFVGRLDDIGHDGVQIALDCHKILQNYKLPSKILGASIRHPKHILDLSQGGLPICTLPFKVFEQLLKHPLTDLGLEKFLADAKKT